MKKITPLLVLAFAFCLTSCAISKYEAPPFTDLDKIMSLKPGMTLADANEALKLKPYDIIYSHDKGKMILIYNYRVKDRRMVLPTKTAGQVIHTEKAQREGETWYNKSYKEVYALFYEGKLKSVYGEEALSIAPNLDYIDVRLDNAKQGGGLQVNDTAQDLDFARMVYQQRLDKKEARLMEDEKSKKRQRILIGGGTLILLWLIGQIF